MTDICISCDRGGTFSDFIAEYTSSTGARCQKVIKLLSVNPASYPDAATEGIRRLLEDITQQPFPKGQVIASAPLRSIRLGTTVATNALLERKGTDIAFVVTEGLEDVLQIGSQSRPSIFDLHVKLPEQIYQEIISVPERVLVIPQADTYTDLEKYRTSFPYATELQGTTKESVLVLKPLDITVITERLRAAYDRGIRSCAVALAHSYAFPDHELAIAQIAQEIGFIHISLSHQVSTSAKLLSRAYTTCADAYLTPILRDYINGFLAGFSPSLLQSIDVHFMQSDGGLTDCKTFTGFRSILSGPAGGFIGFSKTSVVSTDDRVKRPKAQYVLDIARRATGISIYQDQQFTLSDLLGENIPSIGCDIGGTSADVSLSSSTVNGEADYCFENIISGVIIAAPQLNINTVASGGGSILSFDNGLFNVGPHSAGSYPGPACYNQTPDAPLAVTDANCITGRINPSYFPQIFGPSQDQPLNKDVTLAKFRTMTQTINTWKRSQFIQSLIQQGRLPADIDASLASTSPLEALSEEQCAALGFTTLSPEEVALGFLSVSYESICRPIRALTESRGLDPRGFTLCAFGGAAGQLGCALADTLKLTSIYFHGLSSLLSAYGISIAPIVTEKSQMVQQYLQDASTCALFVETKRELERSVLSYFEDRGLQSSSDNHLQTSVYIGVKYQTTDTTLMLECDQSILHAAEASNHVDFYEKISTQFFDRYRLEFGFLLDRPLIVDTIRVRGESTRVSPPIDQPNEQPKVATPHDVVPCFFRVDAALANLLANDTTLAATAATIGSANDNVDPAIAASSTEITGQWIDTPLYNRQDLAINTVIRGPCIIYDRNTTIVVEPAWVAFVLFDSVVLLKADPSTSTSVDQVSASVDTTTTTVASVSQLDAATTTSNQLRITCYEDAMKYVPCQPILLSLFSHRFMSIAEQMGQSLQRTSVSVNIKQRLDFSCAIFTSNGDLLTNAPSLPVHLGSMASCVKSQLNLVSEWIDNDVVLTNHPVLAGGSHLPDMTIITPIFLQPFRRGDKPIFFLASRAHHSDIGGISSGSMPCNSKYLYEEGVQIVSFKVVRGKLDGTAPYFDTEALTALLTNPAAQDGAHPDTIGTRNLADNLNDIRAQIAANNKGVSLMNNLIQSEGLDTVIAYMYHIQKMAENSTRDLLLEAVHKQEARLASVDRGAQSPPLDDNICVLPTSIDYMDDGTPIQLTISINKTTRDAIFDFAGTGAQVFGNTNTPRSVLNSAVIYCLRALVNKNIPLNQGCLYPVTIVVPEHSIISPDATCAVVGGNVLTSQRITDVILSAFGAVANSQGCMNNFTFGSHNYGYYETICGGTGAGPSWDGVTCHSHMTNTQITDIEILERKYPVLVRQFNIRANTGGSGCHVGGNGVVRELQFIDDMLTVNILSERRSLPPRGIAGGGEGTRGINYKVIYNDHSQYTQDPSLTQLINLGGKNAFAATHNIGIRICTPGGGGFGHPSSTKQLDTTPVTSTTTTAASQTAAHNEHVANTSIGSFSQYHTTQLGS